jgi:phosphopantothenoylcysteine decarboxylase/phosphopantothenate--cysteine ligase
MHCVVTAGPTWEPLDQVRRLTNLSTGRLGIELGAFLTRAGHEVTLLLGEQANWPGERVARQLEHFGTTADLRERLIQLRTESVDALFHAAAVSDFSFGTVWERAEEGALREVQAGKIPTHGGVLLAELVPTPKIIAELRDWFPSARLIGWKYEVDGDRTAAVAAGQRQLADCRTDACVVNGPAYGAGFGVVEHGGICEPLADRDALFQKLAELLRS